MLVHVAGAEIARKPHVTGERFLAGDEAAGAADFIFDGLGAETADPPPVVALPHPDDVGRRALLQQTAALAARELHLHLRRRRRRSHHLRRRGRHPSQIK